MVWIDKYILPPKGVIFSHVYEFWIDSSRRPGYWAVPALNQLWIWIGLLLSRSDLVQRILSLTGLMKLS